MGTVCHMLKGACGCNNVIEGGILDDGIDILHGGYDTLRHGVYTLRNPDHNAMRR